MNQKNFLKVRILAVVLFGAIFPSIVIYGAFSDISKLTSIIDYKGDLKNVVSAYSSILDKKPEGSNEYILLSLLITENANQNAMVNKQVMKAAVMQIGFALISIGLLFIVLGLNEGGMDGSGEIGDFKFDFKTASSGLSAIVIGSIVATMGGVLKNEYRTVPVPNYVNSTPILTKKNFVSLIEKCKQQAPSNPNQCVVMGLKKKYLGK
ncbi:hypothetical protein AMS58_19360 [Pseudoalteromonas porphyrae]|uniref:hypothetical protein n=1 Tax=Pseudoalteromonas porphyrae TaxID=187330 RepID=UPI0006BAD4CC|nr:hypothetical protein [Pseudoalteromonas porphyrae]KPH93086.1 hypothetical protein AMS58_19360 [Pseudoalteromonas porphyrae]